MARRRTTISRSFLAVVTLCLLVGAAGEAPRAEGQTTSTAPASASATARIEIDNTPEGQIADWWASFAAEYDPIQFMRENTSPNEGRRGMNESWFAVEAERVKKIGLQGTRSWFQIDWWEPINDNDDPHSYAPDYSGFAIDGPRMQSVYRFLDMCQDAGVEVGLNFGWKLGQPARQWIAGRADTDRGTVNIRDAEEHAESLVSLLKYLREVKKYTCITQVTFGNEHEYNYADMYPAAIRRLEAEGMRDDYVLWGIETNKGMERNLPYVETVDVFTVHVYWPINFEEEINRYHRMLGKHASRTGSTGRVWFSEFALGGDDSYQRGLFVAEALIGSANAGAYAIGGWRLSDQHLPDPIRMYDGRDKANHGLHEWGTWRWVPWMQRPRDVYYAMSLMTRYVPAHSKVLTVKAGGGLSATCFAKKQDYTLVVLNPTDSPRQLNVSFRNAVDRRFHRHMYSRGALPKGDYDTVIPSDAKFEGKVLADSLPARSLAVYTTLPDLLQVELSPQVRRVEPGEQVRFSARVLGSAGNPPKIAWSVDGGKANGTVDAQGVYKAPKGWPAIDPVIVRARLVLPEGAPPVFDPEAQTRRASDGLGVVLFEADATACPSRPEVTLVRTDEDADRGAGSRQFDLGSAVPVGETLRRELQLTNRGAANARYTVRTKAPWLKANQTEGVVPPDGEPLAVSRVEPQTITLTVDTTGLKPGRWYMGHVFIDSPRGAGRDVVDVYFRTAE